MAQNARTRNVEMLEDLKIRSLMASYMMFDRSTKYGNYAFRTLILVAMLMGVAAANIFDYIPVGDDEDWVSVSKMVIGLVSGFSATIQTGKIFLLEYFEKKEKLYNETAAGWQKLELDIRLFLNYIDTATDEDIREFTSKCIQERDNVCSKSKPEGDMYQHYHDHPLVTIEQYRKKHDLLSPTKCQQPEVNLKGQMRHTLNLNLNPSLKLRLNLSLKPSLNSSLNLNLNRNRSLNPNRKPSLNPRLNTNLNFILKPILNTSLKLNLNFRVKRSINLSLSPNLNPSLSL
ncbi:uncharacterized protein LOC125378284 [Haliotis rufescens]|uniref:uncharacterized protein LOC125378284 n=1 Tax=Haliotis rufescens TaxID=6454 RepID=UPI00201F3223|nr:uncharacterized protein LOC125378284 [Haliotis rufescens]